ncbi:hypothetical protein DYQ86_04625 [Acidobacteria bacterium AB60]|nr:hypothetical protein DYQ86_04625 [Acidobacteria bacterium AB60]
MHIPLAGERVCVKGMDGFCTVVRIDLNLGVVDVRCDGTNELMENVSFQSLLPKTDQPFHSNDGYEDEQPQ